MNRLSGTTILVVSLVMLTGIAGVRGFSRVRMENPAPPEGGKKQRAKSAEIHCDDKGDDKTCRYHLNPEAK